MKKFLKGAIPVSVGIGTLLLGSPAWAATTLPTASRTGVTGTGSITWTSSTHAQPITLSAKDSACDGHDVYVQLKVYHPGGSWYSTERRNSTNCGTTTTWSGLYLNDYEGITGVRIHACVDDFGGDSCVDGAYVDNPLNSQ